MSLSSRLFTALPPYFGGKRRLLKHIIPLLASELPQRHWSKSSFLDAFAGGGSVSLAAALGGFDKIISNDWSIRGHLIAQGLFASSTQSDYQAFLQLNQPIDAPDSHWIVKDYSNQVFTPMQAHCLAQWRDNIERISSPATKAFFMGVIFANVF
jgi:adenine-specific DNA methylase